MTSDPKAGPGLEPEVLAAYIDNRLSLDERASVEARLAADPDSREVLVDVMKAQDALGDAFMAEAPVAVKVVGAPGSRWVVAGGLLATAAALVLLVRLSPDLMSRLRGGDRADAHIATLVAAVGDERYVEGRLNGGFRYGSLRPVTRGSEQHTSNLRVIATLHELERIAKEQPDAATFHALGIAQLIAGDYQGAIDSLSAAIRSNDAEPSWRSDLAAAYLQWHRMTGNTDFAERALVEARMAAGRDRTPVTLFNLALAQEVQNLRSDAIATWKQYLEVEGSSDWRSEARRHLAQLESQQ
jgi:tetratricopeptide (TPR) repeat protein